jgi:hypothetical protein
MLPHPESAYFVIADISGYTSFLAGVELDHAQDIIADLMDTVVKGLRPPFRLAKFEGDAAFVYAATAKIDGSMLQDVIEQAYFTFRRRLRDIKQASVCECKACAAMGDLDFKFVAHHGEMVKQKMGGREELAGRDVIVVHRLLKNTVSDQVGKRAVQRRLPPNGRYRPGGTRSRRASRNHRHHWRRQTLAARSRIVVAERK